MENQTIPDSAQRANLSRRHQQKRLIRWTDKIFLFPSIPRALPLVGRISAASGLQTAKQFAAIYIYINYFVLFVPLVDDISLFFILFFVPFVVEISRSFVLYPLN
jgi:hypothetical protein